MYGNVMETYRISPDSTEKEEVPLYANVTSPTFTEGHIVASFIEVSALYFVLYSASCFLFDAFAGENNGIHLGNFALRRYCSAN